MMLHHNRTVSGGVILLCCMLFSACGPLAASTVHSIPLLQNGTGATIADAMASEWQRHSIGETGLSFEFPTHLKSESIGGADAAGGFFRLSGSGVEMYAIGRRYNPESEDGFDLLLSALHENATDACRLIKDDPTMALGIDMHRPLRCSVTEAEDISVVSLIGYVSAAEMVEIGSVLLFLGPDGAFMLDRLFSLEQLSPAAHTLVEDYFKDHPQLTHRWEGEPSSMRLDRQLSRVLEAEISQPSVWISSAMAFMEKIAESARWGE